MPDETISAPAAAADPVVVVTSPPSLEDYAKACAAVASVVDAARAKFVASKALADVDRAALLLAHKHLTDAIAALTAAAQPTE